MRYGKRLISILLVLFLLLNSTPIVSATGVRKIDLEEQAANEMTDSNSHIAESDGATIRIREEVSLRETNSETWLLNDGSYECVVYAQDKYFLNAENTLQLIDNTIEVVSDIKVKQGNSQYKNKANVFDIYFSSNGIPEISINYKSASLSFSPLSANKRNALNTSVSVSNIAVGQVDDCVTLSKLTATGENTVTYADAFSNTDLVYVLENNMLKEYIVLKNSDAPNSFCFLFNVENAVFENDCGNGCFIDAEGNVLFSFADLFAIDTNDVQTDALTYSFESIPTSGNVVVTVTLDEKYFSEQDRTFPVIIDPSIIISSSQTADTCTSSAYPSTNYYLNNYLRSGRDTDFGLRRSFIRFDIPSNIPMSGVTGASLRIEKVAGSTPTVRAFRCVQDWISSTLTWENAPLLTAANCSPIASLYSGNWYSMDVTAIVQLWVNRIYPNYGFTIKDDTEGDENHWTTFYSSDAASPHKPELHITYTPTKVKLINVTESQHDHYSGLANASAYLQNMGYSSVDILSGDFTVAQIQEYLNNNENAVFVSRSHGEIVRNSSYGGIGTCIKISSSVRFSSVSDMNTLDLSNMALIMFIGCYTGWSENGIGNLPSVAVARGAKTAIGFTESICCYNANLFTEKFFEELLAGKTIEQAGNARYLFEGSGLETMVMYN